MSASLSRRSGIIHAVPNHTEIVDIEGSTSLTFYCGELPADGAISDAGHEPNGYFWEGVVQYLAPDLAEEVELDSEAGMFSAYGDRVTLERLQLLIDPYLEDGERVTVTIRQAEASGFQFDD
jgi:hypothetical protein